MDLPTDYMTDVTYREHISKMQFIGGGRDTETGLPTTTHELTYYVRGDGPGQSFWHSVAFDSVSNGETFEVSAASKPRLNNDELRMAEYLCSHPDQVVVNDQTEASVRSHYPVEREGLATRAARTSTMRKGLNSVAGQLGLGSSRSRAGEQ